MSVENLDKGAIESELQKLIQKGETLSKCGISPSAQTLVSYEHSQLFSFAWEQSDWHGLACRA